MQVDYRACMHACRKHVVRFVAAQGYGGIGSVGRRDEDWFTDGR